MHRLGNLTRVAEAWISQALTRSEVCVHVCAYSHQRPPRVPSCGPDREDFASRKSQLPKRRLGDAVAGSGCRDRRYGAATPPVSTAPSGPDPVDLGVAGGVRVGDEGEHDDPGSEEDHRDGDWKFAEQAREARCGAGHHADRGEQEGVVGEFQRRCGQQETQARRCGRSERPRSHRGRGGCGRGGHRRRVRRFRVREYAGGCRSGR